MFIKPDNMGTLFFLLDDNEGTSSVESSEELSGWTDMFSISFLI